MLKAIYFGSTVLCVVTVVLCSCKAVIEFKKRFPNAKTRETSWADKALTVLKLLMASFCPVFNTVVGLTLLFKEEEVCKTCIEEMIKRRSDEELDGMGN